MPSWIQAVAALVSLGVMVWLARLTAQYVRYTDHIAKATRDQVDAILGAAQQRRKSVVAALLEETSRVRGELGPPPADDVQPIVPRGSMVPSIHPWMQPIIPEVSDADPQIVGLFLTLDRDLLNCATVHKELAAAQDALAKVEKELEVHQGVYKNSGTDPTTLHRWGELQHAIKTADQNVDRVLRLATSMYGKCHKDLDALEMRLNAQR